MSFVIDGGKMSSRYPVKPPVAIGEVYEHKCAHCKGSGQEPGLGDLTCRECFGRGRRKWRIEECARAEARGVKTWASPAVKPAEGGAGRSGI